MPNRIPPHRPFSPDTRIEDSSSAAQQEVCREASTIADAMGAAGLERRSASLGGQHPHAMPPRRAVLRWPNRDVSLGSVAGSLASGLTFHPSSITGPLAERGTKAGLAHLPLSGFSPRGIEVVPLPSPGSELSELPWMQPKLLGAVPGADPAVLADLADVASGFDQEGTTLEGRYLLSTMLSTALCSMEAVCEDPVAVRRAGDAIDRNPILFLMSPAEDLDMGDPGEYMCMAHRTGGAGANDCEIDTMLQGLNDGNHVLLRVQQDTAEGAHAMAISATRLGESDVRLSVFNSNGWGQSMGNRYFDHSPAASKTMSITDAVAALKKIDDKLLCPAADLPPLWLELWENPSAGVPLLSWLGNAGPRESMSQLTEQRMVPQKSGDCGIEVEFAWLASVLTPADYKLAKAHVLNMLAQTAETANWSDSELQRLRERITTSLSGYAMSPPG